MVGLKRSVSESGSRVTCTRWSEIYSLQADGPKQEQYKCSKYGQFISNHNNVMLVHFVKVMRSGFSIGVTHFCPQPVNTHFKGIASVLCPEEVI